MNARITAAFTTPTLVYDSVGYGSRTATQVRGGPTLPAPLLTA